MRIKSIMNAGWVVILVLSLLLMAGCGKSAYQTLNESYRKMPNHILNVPPKAITAIDGTWFDPQVATQYSLWRGRLYYVIRLSSQDPPFPAVLVRDIEQVAPGRYRGILALTQPKWKGSIVTFSIIGKDKLFSRLHYPSGKKQDVVYDKVKLKNEQWFLREYEAFLKESQAGDTGSHASGTQTTRPSGGSAGQTKEVSAQTPIVVYKMYTKPGRITPGTKFDLIIEYAVTDPAVRASRIPVTFNLEILKTKNTIQASNLKKPAFPTPDNTDKVHTFKPANIDCPNGKKTSRIVHLSAAKDKGSYYMVAYLKYKSWTRKLSMHLPIN